MTNEDLGDLDLARRISNGDEKALKNLYDNYADFLFAYITHLLNEAPRVVIEDIWQETLLYWLSLPLWVFLDARKYGKHAWLWAIYVSFGNLVALVAYILTRPPIDNSSIVK